MVQFEDGAVMAQLGIPDMKLPIAYALSYPHRLPSPMERLDFSRCTSLTFEPTDTARFPNLALAYEAARRGGNMPCILNAANEIAVAAFLEDRISFPGMSVLIERTMAKASFAATPSFGDYEQTDCESRQIAQSLLPELRRPP